MDRVYYILSGEPKEAAKVLQENRIRVDRGVITFTPCQPGTVTDSKAVPAADSKEVSDTDSKAAPAADSKEVSDTDSKAANDNDAKDVPADDVKEAAPAAKTSKRAKK